MSFSGIAGLALAALVAAAAPPERLEADVICTVAGEPVRLKDFELALFLDDHALVQKNVMPFLVQERVVRQVVSDKGVTVKAALVDGYMKDLDRQLRDRQLRKTQKRTLAEHLKSVGMDEKFFRRKLETTLGLYYLVGGKERPSVGMSDPVIRGRMNARLARLAAKAKVETDLAKLPPGVAATINGEKVSTAEAGRVARMSFTLMHRQMRLAYLLRFVVARQEFRRRGLKFTAADIDYQIKLASAQQRTQLDGTKFSMEEILRKLGRDVDLLKRQYGFRRAAMLSRMVKDGVTEAELRSLFEKAPARFGHGMPKASHILLRTADETGRPLSARKRRQARSTAKKLYAKLTGRKKYDFARLAGEHSEDTRTKDVGGNLGFINPSRRYRERLARAADKRKVVRDVVADTAYALKVGEISKPVLDADGYHVIKVTEISEVSFKEARPLVLAAAVRARRNALEAKLTRAAQVRRGPAWFGSKK